MRYVTLAVVVFILLAAFSCQDPFKNADNSVLPPQYQYLYTGYIHSAADRVFNGGEEVIINRTPEDSNKPYEYFNEHIIIVAAGEAMFHFASAYKPNQIASEEVRVTAGLAGAEDLGVFIDPDWRIQSTNEYEAHFNVR